MAEAALARKDQQARRVRRDQQVLREPRALKVRPVRLDRRDRREPVQSEVRQQSQRWRQVPALIPRLPMQRGFASECAEEEAAAREPLLTLLMVKMAATPPLAHGWQTAAAAALLRPQAMLVEQAA